MSSRVLILDFGSQYTQLIARRVREAKIYCEIVPFNATLTQIKKWGPSALILSGGPASVYDADSPKPDASILHLNLPVLGICYGMQWLAQELGGKVLPGKVREYGSAIIRQTKPEKLFSGIAQKEMPVWMSHGDHVEKVPSGFEVLAESENHLKAAIGDFQRRIYGLQFHPEVV